MGAWIEIDYAAQNVYLYEVAPCVGAWIEIQSFVVVRCFGMSLLAWERGLKYKLDRKL